MFRQADPFRAVTVLTRTEFGKRRGGLLRCSSHRPQHRIRSVVTKTLPLTSHERPAFNHRRQFPSRQIAAHIASKMRRVDLTGERQIEGSKCWSSGWYRRRGTRSRAREIPAPAGVPINPATDFAPGTELEPPNRPSTLTLSKLTAARPFFLAYNRVEMCPTPCKVPNSQYFGGK